MTGRGDTGTFAIHSFDRAGRLVFSELSTAEVYRVEWAPTPTGVWQVISSSVEGISARGSGLSTAMVDVANASARFFRVVATVTNASAGPSAPQGMVLIPGGTNAGNDPDAGAYSLTVNAFWMDRTEVTQSLWEEVYTWATNGVNGYGFDNAGSGKAADHPVQTVNWYDCVKWCNARSVKEGRTPVYYADAAFTQVYKSGQVADPSVKETANGYRLPTDVQWEYAARGGVSGRRFPWGSTDVTDHVRANYYAYPALWQPYDKNPVAGYHPDSVNEPHTLAVGAFDPNGYGLYDMAGNVWEWCGDWVQDAEQPSRVLRGGSWYSYALAIRVGQRYRATPNSGADTVGFRTVLLPDAP